MKKIKKTHTTKDKRQEKMVNLATKLGFATMQKLLSEKSIEGIFLQIRETLDEACYDTKNS